MFLDRIEDVKQLFVHVAPDTHMALLQSTNRTRRDVGVSRMVEH